MPSSPARVCMTSTHIRRSEEDIGCVLILLYLFESGVCVCTCSLSSAIPASSWNLSRLPNAGFAVKGCHAQLSWSHCWLNPGFTTFICVYWGISWAPPPLMAEYYSIDYVSPFLFCGLFCCFCCLVGGLVFLKLHLV